MEENRKKINWKTVVIVVMAFLLLFCLAKINSLNEKNQYLDNEVRGLHNRITSLQDDISLIYDNVDKQLKKEASLLSGVDYSLGELSADKTTTDLNVSVVPKLISDDMKLSITIDGKTSELKKNGNAFVGTIDVGLFVEYDKWPLISIQTAEGTKTEYLENVDISYMYTRFLPSVYADGSGTSTHSGNKLNVDLRFSIDYKPASSQSTVAFTNFTLIEEINGKEVGRKDITDDVQKSGNTYDTTYTKSFQVKKGDELKVYVVAEDSLGYIHKTLAHYWFENEDGAHAETIYGGESIYDKDGNMLYGDNWVEVN